MVTDADTHGMTAQRRLAVASLACAMAFLACLLALHLLTLRSLPWYLSEYANGPYRPLFWAGGYAFALSALSLALCLRRTLPATATARAAALLLLLVVPAAFLATTFPVDRGDAGTTVQGQVHDWSTVPLFLFMTASMLLLVPAFHRHPGWRGLARWSLALGLFSALAEFAYLVGRMSDQPLVGVAQRALVGAVLAWFILIAFGAKRLGFVEPGPATVAETASQGAALTPSSAPATPPSARPPPPTR